MDWHSDNKPVVRLAFLCLIVSLFFHVTFLLVQSSHDKTETSNLDANGPIEISVLPEELLAPPEKKSQPDKTRTAKKEPQIAETEEAGNRELDPNAAYLSDRTQTAKKQTRAKITDDFRAQEGTGLKSSSNVAPGYIPPTGDPNTTTVDAGNPLDIDEGDSSTDSKKQEKNAGIQRNWKTLSLRDLSVGGDGGALGATDDLLDSIDPGNRTILSTREFRYFSYYHRIKQLLRQYWKPSVERRLVRLWSKGQTVKDTEMTTKLLVLLDQSGSIQRISRVNSSGVEEVDKAAEEAFVMAGPFPNPPKGIIDADGFVRIRWDFILKAQASPRIQFRRAGGPLPAQ